ncbi:MAG: hypothetical protein FJZ97_01685, partial [Chloroflexi bacterium]|nr:hypothetical protein [Chloroflexota bacterium]
MAYTVVLVLHNLWRWLVVLAAIYATARAWFGWLGKRPWTKADQRAGTLFGISLDIQFLLGLILAIISPLMQAAYQDLAGLAMQAPFRTFLMEHMPIMFVALILVHVGSAAARKGADDGARHRRAA